MSKQSFTTGQVLTAAQVNTLQANDFNQTVSVKTANYTLAAADKGTRIEFNTSGSVTCTVNSGLFDAGDTLVIQNRGAGTATITAGTATVNTSASLALAQYSSGTLYFVSASAALFFGAAPAGGGSFVGCLARKTSNQSITTNTATAVTFQAEDFDTDAFHSTSTNTSRFTVPAGKAGYYLFGTNLTDIGGGAVNGALALLSFYKNGSQITGSEVMWQKGSIDYIAWGANYVVNAAVNDYFEIFYLNTDEAANVNADRTIAYFYYLGAA